MRLYSFRRRAGFTLIEIIVVVAILGLLVAIAAPSLWSFLSGGDVTKCREQVEQLVKLGQKHSQSMAHSRLLPTSGMADDEDTENIDESEGWWLSAAPYMDSYVLPEKAGKPMRVSTIFHCPGDKRAGDLDSGNGLMDATTETVSYVSWTDGSEDPENPNSCIRTNAKQNLDQLPWLSDGNPVKGESVRDLASFKRMVRPALERHAETIVVAYASGVVKGIELDEEMSDEEMFKLIAPDMARAAKEGKKAGKGKKGKKKSRRAADDEDED